MGGGVRQFLLLVAAGVLATLAADWIRANVRTVRRLTG